jgi:excisionase family DNA binding protein
LFTRRLGLDYEDYLDYAEVDAPPVRSHDPPARPGAPHTLAKPELRYLKVHEVAERLSLDQSTVYKMIRSGLLPSVRIGSKAVRVPAESFEAYLQTIATEEERSREEGKRPSNNSDDVALQLASFVNTTGVNPFVFIDQWKRGSLEDNDENAELVMQALSLRTAIGRRVNETTWRVVKTAEEHEEDQNERERSSLFRRRRK